MKGVEGTSAAHSMSWTLKPEREREEEREKIRKQAIGKKKVREREGWVGEREKIKRERGRARVRAARRMHLDRNTRFQSSAPERGSGSETIRMRAAPPGVALDKRQGRVWIG